MGTSSKQTPGSRTGVAGERPIGTASRPAAAPTPAPGIAGAGASTATCSPPAEPVWFGRADAPLFGWVHRPSGVPVGAVVLCPPLFAHAAPAYPAYVRLARRLQGSGLTVVRFDYRGTGDSAGDLPEDDCAAAWTEDVRHALALARSVSPGPVGLAGVQMGGLLAAAAAAQEGGVDALALWDPCANGRAFLRRQQLLQAMRAGPEPAGSYVELPGVVLTEAAAADLRALRLPATPPAGDVLVLVRPERGGDVAPWAGDSGEEPAAHLSVEALSAAAQEAFLEVDPLDSEVPGAAVERLAGWFAAALRRHGDPSGAGPGPWRASGAARVGTGSDGAAIVERPVRLGPMGLFAMETVRQPVALPLGTPQPVALPLGTPQPVAVFLSSGADVHTGPSRLWVTLARHWADDGVRCVRVDLSGLGDSPARPGQAEQVLRPPEAFDDVADVVTAVADHPRQVVLVGLCSGAYQALEGALEIPVGGVLAVNPALRFTPPELVGTGRVSPRRRICVPRPPWMETTRSRLPRPLGVVAGAVRSGWRRVRPYGGSDAWKAELVRRGVDVYCVCGDAEARALAAGDARPGHWPGPGSFRVDTVPGLDHALLVGEDRALVRARLTDELRRLVTARRAGPSPEGG